MKKPASPKIKIALNGLGRVGRVFVRIAHNNPHFEIAAINSRSSIEMYAHLLKYDTTYGKWEKEVKTVGQNFIIDGKRIPYIQEKGENWPWKKMKIDIAVDATGFYTKRMLAQKHLEAGAKYAVVTAPMDDPDETFVLGINHKQFNLEKHKIVSAGSCTTVCSSLVVKVLEENFGLKQGFINTVHAYTSDQMLLDGSHKDLRRARSAAESIIPTSSGVSKTITKLYPHLKGKISALALRVPIADPSLVVLTGELKQNVTVEKLNKAFEKASLGELKGYLGVNKLPLVSRDFVGITEGAVVDLYSNEVVNGKFVNILAWYDNEWGYVSQTVKLIEYFAKRIAKIKRPA